MFIALSDTPSQVIPIKRIEIHKFQLPKSIVKISSGINFQKLIEYELYIIQKLFMHR